MSLTHYLDTIFIFGIVSVAVLWIARRLGFFHLHSPEECQVTLPTKLLILPFLIFFGTIYLIAPSILHNINRIFSLHLTPLQSAVYLQLAAFSLLMLFLGLFFARLDPKLRGLILKEKRGINETSLLFDGSFGLLAYVIALPVVVFFDALVEMLTQLLFGPISFEQLAVRFLKLTLDFPTLLTATLIVIVFLAPLVEEILFRGFLQTYLRAKVGPKPAILIASLFFSIFHFSLSQGYGNIPILSSLFVFSLFLGFVYERNRSLLSSYTLHIAFNAVTVARLLLFDIK